MKFLEVYPPKDISMNILDMTQAVLTQLLRLRAIILSELGKKHMGYPLLFVIAAIILVHGNSQKN